MEDDEVPLALLKNSVVTVSCESESPPQILPLHLERKVRHLAAIIFELKLVVVVVTVVD